MFRIATQNCNETISLFFPTLLTEGKIVPAVKIKIKFLKTLNYAKSKTKINNGIMRKAAAEGESGAQRKPTAHLAEEEANRLSASIGFSLCARNKVENKASGFIARAERVQISIPASFPLSTSLSFSVGIRALRRQTRLPRKVRASKRRASLQCNFNRVPHFSEKEERENGEERRVREREVEVIGIEKV